MTAPELETALREINLPVKVQRDGKRKVWVATIAWCERRRDDPRKEWPGTVAWSDPPLSSHEVTGESLVSFLDAIEGVVQAFKKENGHA